ncbi:type-2 histone deacetylase 1 [Planococcus citri]|uniref:type-2 histone deacetylase 1 n=1 Tax=Planococcus citri TaxID=170843 RepID=UPI0031F99AC1
MILFWRLHWLWCYCVLHSNLIMAIAVLAAGEEETTSAYKKMLPETARESMKFSNPKYSSILRGTQSGDDSRRLGLDIVKKSNDHLEKKTAPNSVSRVIATQPETNQSTTESVDQQNLDLDDFNASRNARDLTYDTISTINGTIAQGTANNSATKGVSSTKNDTAHEANTTVADNNSSTTIINTTSASVSNNSADNNSSLSVVGSSTSINKSVAPKGASSNVGGGLPTVPTAILKNPKDNENKTKIDSNSTFAKKFSINVKVKNTTSDNASAPEKSPKISNVLVLNETHDNSTDYISDQWHLNETSHDYNVTEDNSKNITLLTGLAEEDFNTNETKISSTSRRTMPESPPLSTLNIALITVAAFAVVSTVSIIGMVSVMLYRRYHWNKPQTLSDKCSNADSTGYIDDSTLKENSEEMYSLDNDSFLNSLEAMTIQNYWAGSIRHTKL